MPFVPFRRDHLRYTSGIICGSGSFEVQFRDHFRSGVSFPVGDHLRHCTTPTKKQINTAKQSKQTSTIRRQGAKKGS